MNGKNIHTFVVCAYKESDYLETCLQALINQTVKTNILISTSTPNDFIYKLAEKYDIRVFETGEPSDIQNDWNKASLVAKTELVTIAHQDDVYDAHYAEEIIRAYERHPDAVILFSDYKPIKNDKTGKRDLNSKIKYLLRIPLKFRFLSNKRFFKVASLAFGNSICCPSVTYNIKLIKYPIFTSNLKFALDWDTFLKLAKIQGRFSYIDKTLIYYRVYNGATTKKFIVDNTRVKEDTFMFNKIWPSFITKIIMKLYKKAYDTYD